MNAHLFRWQKYLNHQVLALIVLSLILKSSLGAEPPYPPGSPEARILFLAQVQNTVNQEQYYNEQLQKIQARADVASLPALEALLNRRDFWHLNYPIATLWHDVLREKATTIWYDIRWKSASRKDKVETAFYGLRPDSPVWLSNEVSRDRVLELGRDARSTLYELLNDKTLKYDIRSPWIVVSVGETRRLLSHDIFAPDDKEIDSVLENGGEWGQMIMVGYLAENKSPKAIPLINKWLLEKDDDLTTRMVVTYAGKLGGLPADVKLRVIRTLCQRGRRTLEDLSKGKMSVDAFDLITFINSSLSRLGPSPATTAYIDQYGKFRIQFQDQIMPRMLRSDPGRLGAYVQILDIADSWMAKIRGQ